MGHIFATNNKKIKFSTIKEKNEMKKKKVSQFHAELHKFQRNSVS